MKIDFHVHSKFSSDCIIEPKQLAEKSKKLGIIPAITDHNSIECHAVMKSLDASFIPGEEIRIAEGGDLSVLYPTELIKPKMTFLETIDRIREQGAIAYLPHMYDVRRAGINTPAFASKVDIIEVFNARCIDPSYNTKAERFAEEFVKLKAAGSDSHFLFEFGQTYTEVPDIDLDNPKILLRALKNTKIVGKPALFFVRGPTEAVHFIKKFFQKR